MIKLVDLRLEHPRGGVPLVTGANLSVAPGETVLVVGAAGVGTSRVVAAALGEVTPSAGCVEVLGRDVGKLRRSSLRLLRRRVGIVPQDLCLLEDRSAQLNVIMPLEIDGIPRTLSIRRAAQVLAQLGLTGEAGLSVDCLGAAARQRVAVARAMVREPEVLIADHPTSMQDAHGAELVCTAISIAAARGAACIVFGRDPALRSLAERHRWRQLALVDGALRPLAELEVDGRTIDDVLVSIDSVPVTQPELVPQPVPGVAAVPSEVFL